MPREKEGWKDKCRDRRTDRPYFTETYQLPSGIQKGVNKTIL